MLDDGSRLGWLIAGQELLRSGGFQSVKLAALCELTGRTTGSFYHHFDGMAAYLGELASFFGVEQPKTVLAELSKLEPERRLAHLERISAELHRGGRRQQYEQVLDQQPVHSGPPTAGKPPESRPCSLECWRAGP